MQQIAELQQARDAVLAKEAASSKAETMIRGLARLKGIGAELAIVLVWEVSAAERSSLTERSDLIGIAGLELGFQGRSTGPGQVPVERRGYDAQPPRYLDHGERQVTQ